MRVRALVVGNCFFYSAPPDRTVVEVSESPVQDRGRIRQVRGGEHVVGDGRRRRLLGVDVFADCRGPCVGGGAVVWRLRARPRRGCLMRLFWQCLQAGSDVEEVQTSPGPTGPDLPWTSLAARLQSVHKAVSGYLRRHPGDRGRLRRELFSTLTTSGPDVRPLGRSGQGATAGRLDAAQLSAVVPRWVKGFVKVRQTVEQPRPG